ncbi:filamentous hemagglutinin N-terminal domain-containing protein, partial [Vreelandella andesensis]
MNRIFRTVWNAAKGRWQVASEAAKSRSKRVTRRSRSVGTVASLATGSLLLLPLSALGGGLPSGGEIRAGSGTIEQSGNTMRINQTTDRMAMDWDDFSVEEGHRVDFNQPSRDAAALNRVTGDQISQIRGAINANGQVFLVNPNGVVFGDTAQVDVGGLVASTLDISPEDFMAGDFTFEGGSSNAIINQGNIRTAEDGYVALIATEIINRGNIEAPRGDVMMGAGSRVTLDMGGPIKIEVEEALLDTYIEQGGAIKADGGRVYLTAKAAGDLAASVINHTGVTQARTLAENEQGEIWLMGDMDSGETQVAGTLDASAPSSLNPEGGDGGFVETSAAKVSIMDEATVTTRADNGETGEWLIDPQDYTIAAEGGDMTGSDLSSNLADNNVTIESVDGGEDGNGDIFVNDEVTWSSDNTLTLDAQQDIEINAAITATGDNAGLELNFGGSDYYVNAPVTLSGTNASLSINSNAYTLIHSMEELGDIDTATGGGHRYALAKDLDASGNTYDDALIDTFSGTFSGLGHEIRNLTIDTTSNESGLFASIDSSGVVRDIGLITGSVASTDSVVGALAGENKGLVNNAYASVMVEGQSDVGGLIGRNNGVIQNSHATGNVEGSVSRVGGLVGDNNGGSISNAYAMGSVAGRSSTGGLVGSNGFNASITNAYATGDVNGSENNIGGLVGTNKNQILNAYATGKVVGTSRVGGLVGANNYDGSVDHSFYTTTDTNGDAIDNDYTSDVGSGKTLVEMRQGSTFTDAGWDENIWSFGAGADSAGYGVSHPYLTNVTRDEDIPDQTLLFDGGFGTEDEPFTLTDWQQLQNINHNTDVLSGGYYYALKNDLDTNTSGYAGLASASANSGEGWEPIGIDFDNSFIGTFDGLGHSVSSLNINRPDESYAGLFGYVSNNSETPTTTIKNIGVMNAKITGDRVGGLVGSAEYSNFENIAISNIEINADEFSGGLIGYLWNDDGRYNWNSNDISIKSTYSSGNINATNGYAGGLIGEAYSEDGLRIHIADSYSSAQVNGNNALGGLLGSAEAVTIKNSYASGAVNGTGDNLGGLVGRAYQSGDDVSILNSFWDVETSGIGSAGDVINGATGLTSAEMQQAAIFADAGWDETIWSLGGNNIAGYAAFRPYLTNVTADADIPDQNLLFDDGFGTEDEPFTLTDWQQLQNINHNTDVLSGGYYYALKNDLDTNTSGYNELASATANENKGWEPIGTFNNRFNRFAGTFDGLGHTLSDMHINRPTEDFVGLFGAVSNNSNTPTTVIKNIGVSDATVTGKEYVGGLAGYAGFSDFEKISINDITLNAEEYAGGAIGYLFNDVDEWSSDISIKSSYSSGTINSTTGKVGGLIGEAYSWLGGGDFVYINVEDSYSTASVSGDTNVAGLVAYVNAVNISNSYAAGAVSSVDEDGVGGLVARDYDEGGSPVSITNSFWDVGTTGIGSAGDDNFGATGLTSAEMQQAAIFADAGWDESIWSLGGARTAGYGVFQPYLANVTRDADIPDQSPLFDDGFGTEDEPFTLTSWQQLQNINFNDDVLTGGHHFALVSSLDAGSEGYTDLASASANGGEGWKPIGGASSDGQFEFDGGNLSIGDLTIANDRYNLGLFGSTTGASISNLTLHNPAVSTTGFSYGVGALAGRIHSTTVDNVTVSGDQANVAGYFETGGLVGSANMSYIDNSTSAAIVTGDPASLNTGGLIGFNYQTQIEDSSASGAVSGNAHVGGLVGRNTSGSLIRNSQATGNVTIPDTASEVTRGYAGGFVGRNQGTVENASASGDVTGLVGDDFASDNLLGIGSFVGDNSGTLDNVDASGTVTVTDATGNETVVADGLLGRNSGLLANGLAVYSNTAHWLQNDASFLVTAQPVSDTEIAADDVRERLDSGINVAIATTGTGRGISAQDPVNLGNADQHSASLSLDTAGSITLESTQALRLGETSAVDAIEIATANDNLHLAGNISTADTSDQALLLAAGRSEDAGSATGGDIVYTSGDLITGAGGRTMLYTGSLAGSEDIADLIATGDFRYNSNETNSNFTAALDGTRHLIYREQPEILVSAQDVAITYGDAMPASYTEGNRRGFVNGDDASILDGTVTWSFAADLSGAGVQVAGTHNIDYFAGLTNALGYAIANDSAQPGELTVDTLTLTATDIAAGGSVYGDTLAPGDVNLSGALTGDDVESVAELVNPALSSSGNMNVGTYDQQAGTDNISGSDAGNYTLDSFTKADSYVVDPRAITVAADNIAKIYGENDPTLTWQVTDGNLVGDDSLAGDLNRETGKNVGNYDISAAYLENGNYMITAVNGELTIDPRPITVSADDQQKTYGNADPALTWQVTDGNLVGNDNLAGDLNREAGNDVGNYDISPADLENGNYVITAIDGKLTIDPRPITVTADDQQKTYGNADPALTWQVTD